jgi:hypothetical protein
MDISLGVRLFISSEIAWAVSATISRSATRVHSVVLMMIMGGRGIRLDVQFVLSAAPLSKTTFAAFR